MCLKRYSIIGTEGHAFAALCLQDIDPGSSEASTGVWKFFNTFANSVGPYIPVTMTSTTSANTTWVAAIDVGTSYSCYGYSPKISHNAVVTSIFNEGSSKTPTSILLNKDKAFVAFGEEAEDLYRGLLSQNVTSHYLFTEFKMAIHDNPNLSITKTMATDISGKWKIPAFRLFTMAIMYLKNHLLKAMNCTKETYSEDDIHFVLTCPSIWNDRAKYYLRQVGIKAGIRPEYLTIAYASESVSLWCKTLQLGTQGTISLRSPGTKYVVVDVGGGVVDISYHEATGNMAINTTSPSKGGVWGGIVVDKCFKNYLALLFGSEAVNTFQESHSEELFKLLKDFENVKKSVLNDDKGTTISIPRTLLNLAQKYHSVNEEQLSNKIKSSHLGDHFNLTKQTLEIDSEFSLGMFDYTAKQIGVELQNITPNVDTIVLTGELAGVVKSKLKDLLKGQKVVVPQDNSLFVIKGAVLYGHDPKAIRTRVPSLTYGIKTTVPYNETKHSGGQTTVINGTKMCTNNFHVLLKAGTKIDSGHQLKEKDKPLTADDKVQILEIFSCGKSDMLPTLTSDPTVTPVAKYSFPLPFGALTDDKVFDRCFTFGETEITCQITLQKGNHEPFKFYMEYK